MECLSIGMECLSTLTGVSTEYINPRVVAIESPLGILECPLNNRKNP